jgi:hypothetical protein
MRKKVSLLVSVLVLALVLIPVVSLKTYNVKAAAKLIDKYFPNGIEKIKPYKPIINIDESDTRWIWSIVKQNDDVLKLVRDYEASTEYVEFKNDWYESEFTEFEVKYGINALETTVQFDISVDGGDWQYNKSWDKKEQDMYSDGFTFYTGFGGGYDDNAIEITLMEADAAAEGKLLKKTLKNDAFDLKNHTFKVRYRYCIQFGLLDDYEAGLQYYFTDWSDTATFGKTTDQNLEIPDEIPAPDTSNPKRELGENGKWGGYVSMMTHFSQEVTDAATAIYINKGVGAPFMIIVEAAVDDLSEKKFDYDGYMANADSLSDGQRGIGFDKADTFTEKSRILIRTKLQCDTLGKDSKYDYAVDKVKGLKVKKAKTTSLTLTWSKVDGAEFYEIYDKNNKLVTTSKTNSVTIKKLKAATGYDYKVRAVVDKVFVGLFSDTLQCATLPKKTAISKVSMANGSFNISYKKKAGTGYQIQVAADKKFKDTVIDEKVNGTKTVKYNKDVEKLSTSVAEKPTYYARVRVYFTYGDVTTYSSWSKVKSFTAK